MKFSYLKTILFLSLFISFATILVAQETVSATGGEGSGTDGTISYTVGQVAYTTNPGSGGVSTQGVQQPFEIFVITGIEDIEEMELSVLVYPNPTIQFLTLKIKESVQSNYQAALYDFSGKLLQRKNITSSNTIFDTNNLVSATYLLKVTENGNMVKTFKIIKN